MDGITRIAVAGLVGASLAWQVAAQATTSAICVTDLWTKNAEGISPCLVAAALQGACNGGKFAIPPLPTGRQYSGPDAGFGNVCTCSTVTYSMVAACGACQGASIDTWTDWHTNCTTDEITVSGFPLSIPPGTTVPAWAYLDVTVNGVWDATAAEAAADQSAPDSSASGPTATSSPGSTNGAGGSSSSSQSSTPIGAIVGGAVGGVVAIALIGGLIFFLVRRSKRNKRNAPSARFTGAAVGEKVTYGAPGPGQYSPAPPVTPYYTNGAPMSMQDESQKLYNPADPSTFPSMGAQTPVPTLPGYTSPAPAGSYGGQTSPAPPAPYGGPALYGTPESGAPYGAPPPASGAPYGESATPYGGGPPTSTPYGGGPPTSTPYGGGPPTLRPYSQQTFGGGGYSQVPQGPATGHGYSGTPEV